jgi:ABC-type transporter Mla subunit MlaD
LDNLLDVLVKLIPLAKPLIPGAGAAPEIVAAVAALIKHIQQQNGKTTDEILAEAGATLDDTDKLLLENRIRLGMN